MPLLAHNFVANTTFDNGATGTAPISLCTDYTGLAWQGLYTDTGSGSIQIQEYDRGAQSTTNIGSPITGHNVLYGVGNRSGEGVHFISVPRPGATTPGIATGKARLYFASATDGLVDKGLIDTHNNDRVCGFAWTGNFFFLLFVLRSNRHLVIYRVNQDGGVEAGPVETGITWDSGEEDYCVMCATLQLGPGGRFYFVNGNPSNAGIYSFVYYGDTVSDLQREYEITLSGGSIASEYVDFAIHQDRSAIYGNSTSTFVAPDVAGPYYELPRPGSYGFPKPAYVFVGQSEAYGKLYGFTAATNTTSASIQYVGIVNVDGDIQSPTNDPQLGQEVDGAAYPIGRFNVWDGADWISYPGLCDPLGIHIRNILGGYS